VNHNIKILKVRYLLLVLIIAFIGVLIRGIQWATYARPPLPDAVAALEGDEIVTIALDPWLTFSPTQNSMKTGFIFYPGGRINPTGYAPLMKAIATNGYLVIVPEMPINMAVFNADIANEIIAFYPEIEHWVIGGHSVGGTAAAQYTAQHPNNIAGLAIWASYPAANTNISDLDIPVVSIYGSLDPRVNAVSVGERKHLLPVDTQYVQIEGGDHHQFGSYEIKPEEHLAITSRVIQQQQIIQASLELLQITFQQN
jgi:hypothetical protein